VNDDVPNIFGREEKLGICNENMLNADRTWLIEYWNDICEWWSMYVGGGGRGTS